MLFLLTIFIMMFIVGLINGNMIGRHDGVRANSNCMVALPRAVDVLLFWSRRKKYNLWSVLSQLITILYFLFTSTIQLFKQDVILHCFKTILISFVIFHAVLYLCLFIDVLICDYKFKNRY